MANQLGKYRIPRPFQDEDKWFRYFTKKQLIYVGFSLVILIRLIFWVKDYNALVQIPVLTVGCIIMICALMFGMLTMPDDRYLSGGGITIERLVVRLLRKRLKGNRVLYVRNYNPKVKEDAKVGFKGKAGGVVNELHKRIGRV